MAVQPQGPPADPEDVGAAGMQRPAASERLHVLARLERGVKGYPRLRHHARRQLPVHPLRQRPVTDPDKASCELSVVSNDLVPDGKHIHSDTAPSPPCKQLLNAAPA